MVATFALSSCSDEEKAPGVATPSDNSIQFNTYVDRSSNAVSRGTALDITGLQGLPSGFGVYASYTAGKGWADGDQIPNYMYNQQVGWSGSQWTYSPLKYWPGQKGEKISFLAYAPYQKSVTTGRANTGITYFDISDDEMRLIYRIGTDVKEHQDLLVAQALDQTSDNQTVNLKFSHALAKVGFKVYCWENISDKNSYVLINGISLSTALELGALNLKSGKMEFAGETGETTGFILTGDLLQNREICGIDHQGKQLNADDAYIMVMPDFNFAGEPDPYCVVVDYTVVTIDNNVAGGEVQTRSKVYKYIRPCFEAGKSYTLAIHLGLDGGGNGGGGGDDPNYPEPVDPNPGDGGDPTPGGNGGYVTFSATVNDWDNTGDDMDVELN